MKKIIPYEKLSKKEQRKQNRSKRTVWGFSPVTRRKESARLYNRKKTRCESRNDFTSCLFY